MGQQTCKVLYAKYNSARRPDFRVTTEFCEDENGIFVRKRAGEPAAEAHLERICNNSLALQDYYRNVRVILPIKDNGALRVPHIKGQTLAEQIEAQPFDKAHFITRVNERLAKVLAIREKYVVPFEMTDDFEAVFGRVEFGDVPALNPVNIDSLFTNFIENDEGLYCIDCEWVCHFPVPIDFIKYRILLYLYVVQVRALLKGISLEEMLGWFGFSEQECAVYWQMDDRFQQHVHGDSRQYLYTVRYRKENLSLDDIDREIHVLKQSNAAKENHIGNLENIIRVREDVIHDKDVHIGNLEEAIRDRDDAIHDKDVHIGNLEEVIRAREDAIHDKDEHIGNLEEAICDREDAIHDKDEHIGNLEEAIREREGAIHDKDVHIGNLERIIQARDAQIGELNTHVQSLNQQYQTVSNAFFWRITKPARVTLDALKRFIKTNESVYLFCRTAKDAVRHGFKYALHRRREYIRDKNKVREANSWPSEEEKARQREKRFPQKIKFSILVPLYNTPENFLRAMIQSVQDQTYENWELCLADGSDAEHKYVRNICKACAARDKRIRYKKLEENKGISGNTNACIEMASGDYIALFDHDDILHPSALYEDMIAICEQDADFIYTDEVTFRDQLSNLFNPHFKPDYAPDTLRANNYICHFTVFKRDLLEKAGGGFRPEYDGSQDFDMVLRLTEQAQRIVHIPKILYYWRAHSNSVAESVGAKPYVIDAAKRAISDHLKRVGLEGEVLDSVVPSMYRLKYRIQGEPLISILIPNMDHIGDLKRCVDSIREKSTYSRWEIIIIENNSQAAETFAYYDELTADSRIRVITWDGPFNYSAINNYGYREAKGDHILLLNNDTEVISPDWLQEMLMYSQRSDVGAVGAKLYYPDHTIQHAGLGIGLLTLAGHYHRHFDGNHPGYMGRLIYAQNVSGVTAACMMLPRHVYEEMGGLDESFEVAFNDVDLCMRIRKAGYLIVFTPFAELYHYESKSRGSDEAPEKRARFVGEVSRFQKRWAKELAAGDPYYNPNFSLDREDFSIR